MIYLLDYIYKTGTLSWDKAYNIDTGIYASTATDVRINYKGAEINIDRIAGFSQEGSSTDDNDLRIFYYSNGTIDVGVSRYPGLNFPLNTNNKEYDISFGYDSNKYYYVYNNLTSSYILSKTNKYGGNVALNEGIKIDVGGQYVHSLQITNNGIVVFDGYAAFDASNNTIGLYDTITKTIFTNNNLSLTYGNIIGVISGIELSTSALTFTSGASSSTVTVSSNNPWTATTQDDWITLSQLTGDTGETTITISVSSNIFSDRTGTVSFTDGEETIYLTVNQKKNTSVRLKNIYLENTRIDKMYCNGDLIYQSLIKPVFSLSTDELIIETGQTGTFDITANDRWTISAPEWLTISQSSGYGNATISVTMGLIESAGTIDVTCYNQTKSISVDSQKDYSKEYLTFKIKSNGYIRWMCSTSSDVKTISYSKDNGNTWSAITSSLGSQTDDSGGVKISVSTGDIVLFKGSNVSYGDGGYYSAFERTFVECEVYGNLMSMIYGDNFINKTLSAGTYNFRNFFSYASGITSIENLILPATVTSDCYEWGFQGCIFPKAPVLPATSLTTRCYRRMLRNNPNLSYVKCLASSGNNSTNLESWISNVSATGTFVKKSGVSWLTGDSGIPSGWTVLEE